MVKRDAGKDSKRRGDEKEGVFSIFMKNILLNMKNNILSGIKENIYEKIHKIKVRLIKSAVAFALFIFGILILFLALIFFLIEFYLRFYWGFCDNFLFCTDENYEYVLKPNQNAKRFRSILITNKYAMRSEEVRSGAIKILGFGDSVLNGGVLTSHDELATTILSKGISAAINKDVQFLNISSPSWGPDNAFAYLEEKGNFDAELIILFVNSHDVYDNMSFRKVVDVHPSFPSKNYKCALYELMHRYLLPRLKAFLKGEVYSHAQYEYESNSHVFNTGFQNFYDYTQIHNTPFVIYLHADLSELQQGAYSKQGQLIIEFAKAHQIPLIEVINHGLKETHYRDKMHLNARGQSQMARIVYEFIKAYYSHKNL